MRKKVKAIYDALYNVDCAQDVYDALKEVPTENLKDMINMITFILKNRGEMN